MILAPTDGTTDPKSIEVDATSFKDMSFQIITTGTLAGTLKKQCSNVPNPGPNDWADMPSNTTVTTASNQISAYANFCTARVRTVFTHSGGTGNISVYIMSKGW